MSDTIIPQVELATPRLRLRRLRASDAGLIALHASDPKLARMTTSIPHPYPPGLAETFVDRHRAPGTRERVWVLDAGAEHENGLIGLIAVKATPLGSAELGYWVAPAYWGTGYASEAVGAIADHAVATGLAMLDAQVFQDNPASIRVLLRCGFVHVGEGALHSVARAAMVPTFRYRRELRDA